MTEMGLCARGGGGISRAKPVQVEMSSKQLKIQVGSLREKSELGIQAGIRQTWYKLGSKCK